LTLRHALIKKAYRLGTNLIKAYAQAFQNASGHTLLLAKKTEKEMLRANVIMIETSCLVYRELDNPLRSGSKANVLTNAFFTSPNNVFYGAANFFQINTEVGKYLSSYTLALTN
jgi:hypothetical protein